MCFFNERTFRFKTKSELQDIEILFFGVVNGQNGGEKYCCEMVENIS